MKVDLLRKQSVFLGFSCRYSLGMKWKNIEIPIGGSSGIILKVLKTDNTNNSFILLDHMFIKHQKCFEKYHLKKSKQNLLKNVQFFSSRNSKNLKDKSFWAWTFDSETQINPYLSAILYNNSDAEDLIVYTSPFKLRNKACLKVDLRFSSSSFKLSIKVKKWRRKEFEYELNSQKKKKKNL